MSKRLAAAAIAAMAISASIGAGSASAATEFGDACLANQAANPELDATLFEISAPGNPLPVAAPVAGVITKWKLDLVPVPFGVPTSLRVLRVDAGTKTALVVGESTGTVVGGPNAFDARIPVQAGDRLGLHGPGNGAEVGTLYCQSGTGEASRYGAFEGGGGVGSSQPYEEGEADVRVPATAVIEPDADNDGYGDETQDKCPQSATVQTACPVITLDSISFAGRSIVTVYVATSLATPVSVSGAVKVGTKTVTLSGGNQNVAPGTLTPFALPLPNSVIKKLKTLKKSKGLTLNVSASATNVAGQVSTDVSQVKLKGLKKAVKPKKKQKK